MARRSAARFVRPAPRTKIWIGFGVGITSIVASADQVIGVLSAGALALRPFTILRTHMVLGFASDQSIATERPQGTFGAIVVTETAAAIGTTAIPDPSTTDGDPDADWFLMQECMATLIFKDATGIETYMQQYIVDSKAKRKVGPQDDVVQIFSETVGVGANLITRGRQLIQLH